MKYSISLSLLLILLFTGNHKLTAQCYDWQGAITSDGDQHNQYNSAYNVAFDSKGNIYSSILFKNYIKLAGKQYVTQGDYDLLIVKYNSVGELKWEKRISGNGNEFGEVYIDNNDNVYVLGTFRSDSLITEVGVIYSRNPLNYEIFLLKMDSNANILWQNSFSNVYQKSYINLDFDKNNNIWISGYYHGDTLYYGSDTIITQNPESGTGFLCKINQAGILISNYPIGKGCIVAGNFVFDKINNLYVSASLGSDTVEINNKTYYRSGSFNTKTIFIKYDNSMNIDWVIETDSQRFNVFDMVLAKNNTIDITFSIDTKGGLGYIGSHSFEDGSGIVNLDSNGLLIKQKVFFDARVLNLFLNSKNHLYAFGFIQEDSCNIEGIVLYKKYFGSIDMNYFIAEFDQNDSLISIQTFYYLSNQNRFYEISVNNNNELIACGIFGQDSTAFGPDTLIKHYSGYKFFIAKLKEISSHLSKTNNLCFGEQKASINLELENDYSTYTYNWSNADTTEDIDQLASGKYKVTIKGEEYCWLNDSIELIDPPKLNTQLQLVNDTNNKCLGNANAIVSGGTSPYSYLWDDPQSQITANATELCAGTYQLKIIDSNYCELDTVIEIQNIIVEDVAEENLNSGIKVYPNPNQGNVLVIEQVKAYDRQTIAFYNLNGKLVYTIEIAEGKNYIQLDMLKKGVYYLKMISNRGNITLKKVILF